MLPLHRACHSLSLVLTALCVQSIKISKTMTLNHYFWIIDLIITLDHAFYPPAVPTQKGSEQAGGSISDIITLSRIASISHVAGFTPAAGGFPIPACSSPFPTSFTRYWEVWGCPDVCVDTPFHIRALPSGQAL